MLAPVQNSQWPWDDFDATRYWECNYVHLIDEDRQIIDQVSQFFASIDLGPNLRALDVGTGANLYPALLMLPFCRDLTLWEYSQSGVLWLKEHLSHGEPGSGTDEAWPWDPFWSVMRERPAYRIEAAARAALSRRAEVVHDSLFQLSRAGWDIGTMFFVAESVTADLDEFNRALACFFAALRPGAPFAMAFMEHSTGYDVGGVPWPAVNIGQDELARGIGSAAESLTITRIEVGSEPLRDGYTGMLLAYGHSAR
jgi:hypothetical protein